MKAVDAVKAFFSTPDKPVSSKELMAFAKGDKAGYTEVKDLVVAHYAALGDEVEVAVEAVA